MGFCGDFTRRNRRSKDRRRTQVRVRSAKGTSSLFLPITSNRRAAHRPHAVEAGIGPVTCETGVWGRPRLADPPGGATPGILRLDAADPKSGVVHSSLDLSDRWAASRLRRRRCSASSRSRRRCCSASSLAARRRSSASSRSRSRFWSGVSSAGGVSRSGSFAMCRPYPPTSALPLRTVENRDDPRPPIRDVGLPVNPASRESLKATRATVYTPPSSVVVGAGLLLFCLTFQPTRRHMLSARTSVHMESAGDDA